MKLILFFIMYLHTLNAFIFNNKMTNRFKLNLTNNNIENDNVEDERKVDIFDKFELYASERKIDLQNVYLFKIQQYLAITSDFDKYKQYLLEDNLEEQKRCLLRIKKHVDIQMQQHIE